MGNTQPGSCLKSAASTATNVFFVSLAVSCLPGARSAKLCCARGAEPSGFLQVTPTIPTSVDARTEVGTPPQRSRRVRTLVPTGGRIVAPPRVSPPGHVIAALTARPWLRTLRKVRAVTCGRGRTRTGRMSCRRTSPFETYRENPSTHDNGKDERWATGESTRNFFPKYAVARPLHWHGKGRTFDTSANRLCVCCR